MPSQNNRAGKFLDDARPISDYPFSEEIGLLEVSVSSGYSQYELNFDWVFHLFQLKQKYIIFWGGWSEIFGGPNWVDLLGYVLPLFILIRWINVWVVFVSVFFPKRAECVGAAYCILLRLRSSCPALFVPPNNNDIIRVNYNKIRIYSIFYWNWNHFSSFRLH